MNQVVTMSSAQEPLLDAMSEVPRELFAPKKAASVAYLDAHVMDADLCYMLAPLLFAQMVTMLNLAPKKRVLDIGTSSGYSSAIFSRMGADVTTLDAHDSLLELAKKNHLTLKLPSIKAARADDLESILSSESGFDAIFIHGAISYIPEQIQEALAPGGRLVAAVMEKPFPLKNQPVFARIMLVTRHDDSCTMRELFTAQVPVLAFPFGPSEARHA